MTRLEHLFLLPAVLIVFLGCSQTKVMSQKDILFLEQPELESKYKQLGITSFYAHKNYLYDELSNVTTLLGILREKYPNNKDLVASIDELEKRYIADYNDRTQHIKGFSKEDLLAGDEIYFFEFVDGEKPQLGIIVINDGKIRERILYMGKCP
ncbi:MAG: hypothetical protein ACFFCW_23905 [Candidatus Hodarchaeota archaeon]